jgi:hypothetical protein
MKSITVFLTLCLMVVTTGCEDTQGEFERKTPEDKFEGTWMMKRVSGGMTGIDEEIPNGTIMWTFNTKSQKVTVQNNTTNNTIPVGLESGTYTYGFMNSNSTIECETTLIIDGADYGCYIFTGNGLRISHDYADGYIYDFAEVK